jgi:Fe-S-cluster containining protein
MTVLLMPGDRPPARYLAEDEHGLSVMAKGDDGWCAALDPLRMRCSIYPLRPSICREFAMGGDDCRAERAAFGADPATGA